MASETLADIVAEMRELAADIEAGNAVVGQTVWRNYADRIEAAAKREIKAWKEAVLDFCNAFTLVYPPNDGDCPVVLAGAFELFKDAMGIETVEVGKGETDGSK